MRRHRLIPADLKTKKHFIEIDSRWQDCFCLQSVVTKLFLSKHFVSYGNCVSTGDNREAHVLAGVLSDAWFRQLSLPSR
jgi:hypothetical protein